MGLRQLSGMLVLVFARSALRDVLGEVSTASVACGVLGVGGNKGAVALGFTLYRRKLAVVCSHFAAHQAGGGGGGQGDPGVANPRVRSRPRADAASRTSQRM